MFVQFKINFCKLFICEKLGFLRRNIVRYKMQFLETQGVFPFLVNLKKNVISLLETSIFVRQLC